MKERFILITILAVSLIFVGGCGKPTNAPATGHPLTAPLVSKCQPGQPGGQFKLAMHGAPRTFNPMLAGDGASDDVVRLLFATLVRTDMETGTPGPGLAESWSVAPDQKTWTIKLRPGVRWSDGHPLTADDVVFTWNDVMYDPNLNQLTYELFQIAGRKFSVTKVDGLTVRIVTPEVFAPFLELLAAAPVLPKHTFEPVVKQGKFLSAYAPGAHPSKIVGAGPFRLKDSQPGKFVLLERNPEYWVVDSQGRRLPYFDEVLLLATDGGAGAVFAFLDGKTDAFERGRPELFPQFQSASASGKFRVIEMGQGMEREFLWFNQNTNTSALGKSFVEPKKLSWFRNRAFRQAVSCAIDRDRLVREGYAGRAQPILTLLSAENKKWNNSNVPLFGYDPARAKTLLAGIGLEDRNGDGVLEDASGTAVEFTLHSNTGNPLRGRCAALIAEDLRKLGLKANVQLIDFSELVERINLTFGYECAFMGLGGGATDPAAQVNVLKSSDPLHQWFPNQKWPSSEWEARVDSLMDALMRSLDDVERKKSFDEVQVILAEEMPMIYTVVPFHFAAVRNDLANLRPSLATPYRVTWNVDELYFKKP